MRPALSTGEAHSLLLRNAYLDVDHTISAHEVFAALVIFEFKGGIIRQGTIDLLRQLRLFTSGANNQLARGICEAKLNILL